MLREDISHHRKNDGREVRKQFETARSSAKETVIDPVLKPYPAINRSWNPSLE